MIRRRPGQFLLWLLVALIAATVLAGARPGDFSSASALLDWLGRVAAVVGLVMLLLSAALSARVPGFDRYFGGLTRLWKTHHRLGAGSLLLLMAHPLLLALAAAEGGIAEAVDRILAPPGDWALWTGWAALTMMMIFLAPSFHFFGRPDYQRWKILHRLAGPAVLLALVHSWHYGRTLAPRLEAVLWVLLGLLALTALVWHFALSRQFGRRRYAVERVIMVANNLVELVLTPIGRRRLDYRAGQFVYLTPFDEAMAAGHGQEHPYTLSSSPLEDRLRIAIKDLGDASRAIQAIQPGSRVTVEGPYGDFFPVGAPAKQLWIAGGIGITPFLGRARHLALLGKPADITLIYCVQDEARARFLDELRQIGEAIDGFRVVMHFFYRQGRLDRAFVDQHCPDAAARAVFICGPAPLNQLARRIVLAAGVRRANIQTEDFELV